MEEVFGTFWRDVLGDDDDDDDDDDDGSCVRIKRPTREGDADRARGAGSEGEPPGD